MGRKWTEEQRKKFQDTMRKKFGNRELQETAKHIVKSAKKSAKKTAAKPKETSIVINGWRVTLSKHQIRIDSDE